MTLLHEELTNKVIKSFYCVYNTLGYGFLEKVYVNALHNELQKEGLSVMKQEKITVYYEDEAVGEYYSDLMVEDTVILEIKAAENLSAEHENQLVNYLKATDKEVGLLLNFGKKPQFKRKIFENINK